MVGCRYWQTRMRMPRPPSVWKWRAGEQSAIVRVELESRDSKSHHVAWRCEKPGAWDGFNPAWVQPEWDADILLAGWKDRADRVLILSLGGDEYPVPAPTTLLPSWNLRPGETRVAWLVRPYRAYQSMLPALRRSNWAAEFKASKDAWHRLINRSARITIPDPGVQNAFHACLADCFVMREPLADGTVSHRLIGGLHESGPVRSVGENRRGDGRSSRAGTGHRRGPCRLWRRCGCHRPRGRLVRPDATPDRGCRQGVPRLQLRCGRRERRPAHGRADRRGVRANRHPGQHRRHYGAHPDYRDPARAGPATHRSELLWHLLDVPGRRQADACPGRRQYRQHVRLGWRFPGHGPRQRRLQLHERRHRLVDQGACLRVGHARHPRQRGRSVLVPDRHERNQHLRQQGLHGAGNDQAADEAHRPAA